MIPKKYYDEYVMYLFFEQEREREPKSPPHGDIIESVNCKKFKEIKYFYVGSTKTKTHGLG